MTMNVSYSHTHSHSRGWHDGEWYEKKGVRTAKELTISKKSRHDDSGLPTN